MCESHSVVIHLCAFNFLWKKPLSGSLCMSRQLRATATSRISLEISSPVINWPTLGLLHGLLGDHGLAGHGVYMFWWPTPTQTSDFILDKLFFFDPNRPIYSKLDRLVAGPLDAPLDIERRRSSGSSEWTARSTCLSWGGDPSTW